MGHNKILKIQQKKCHHPFIKKLKIQDKTRQKERQKLNENGQKPNK